MPPLPSPRRGAAYVLLGPLLAANVAAWLWARAALGDSPALLATALLAWVFGLRHAVDADHIAAIDNVVRKLAGEGRRSESVGLWFSLGHSTVVVLASAGIAAVAGALDGAERLRDLAGGIGTAASASILVLLGLANLAALRGAWRGFQAARGGAAPVHAALPPGPLGRVFGWLVRLVARPWQMYALGFLFALGFDTASEIGLLGISAAQGAKGSSPWSVLVFPALFAAGMALVDTADSLMMSRAYAWAFVNPLRKLWYNLTMTAASVAVALLVGGVEAGALVTERFGLEGAPWRMLSALNDSLAGLGFAVVGAFALCWAVSVAIYRWKRLDAAPARR